MAQELNSAAAILDRLRAALKVKNDSRLAAALGVSPGAISQWRKEGRVGVEYVVEAARAAGLSLDWIFTGTEVASAEHVAELVATYNAETPDTIVGVLNAMLDKGITDTPEQIAALELRRMRLLAEASMQSIDRLEAAIKAKEV